MKLLANLKDKVRGNQVLDYLVQQIRIWNLTKTKF